MPGPQPLGPAHRLAGNSQRSLLAHCQRVNDVSPQSAPMPQQGLADSDVTSTSATQLTGLTHKWMLHQEAMAMKLLAGQERVEALLRDSIFSQEFTGSSASTGDFSSQTRPKWNRKASVVETPLVRALTPPSSARSTPTPRKMQLNGGGLLRYRSAFMPDLMREKQPKTMLQRLSPRLPHAKVLNSQHQELKNQVSMPQQPLHKPLDIDLYSPANLESNNKTLTNAPSTISAQNHVSDDNVQNEVAEMPSNSQRASSSNLAKDPDSTFDKVRTEKREPKDEVQEPKELPPGKSKTFRITTMTRATVESEMDGDAEDTNWDASSHWRKMIRAQERKMYKGKTANKWSRSFMGDGDVKESRLSTFIKGQTYENIGIILVVINAIFIGYQVEHFANTNTLLDFRIPVDMTFAILFLIEFLGKVYAWGCWRLFSKGPENNDLYWNIFDLTVVSFMWLELAMELQIIPTSEVSNMSILRILRILRLVRVVKIMRTLKLFRELRLMILAISKGSLCLVWVIGVLNTAFYIFGVSLTQGANDYCPGANYGDGQEELKILCDNFGTIPKSCLSLYAAMSGGLSWLELLHALAPLGPVYMSIFLFYTIFSIFAVANIITGIFVDSAMQSSKNDQDTIIEDEMQKREEYVNSIHKIFMDLDQDDSGTIAVREFEQVVKSDKMAAYFNALGLEITDVKSLFALLDRDMTGAIDVEEFLVGCLRLKGEAKSLDIAKLQMQNEWMMETLDKLCDGLRNSSGEVLAKPAWR